MHVVNNNQDLHEAIHIPRSTTPVAILRLSTSNSGSEFSVPLTLRSVTTTTTAAAAPSSFYFLLVFCLCPVLPFRRLSPAMHPPDLPPQSSVAALVKEFQVVSTTTVFSSPTIITLPEQTSSSSIPIGPIVGGVLGGVFLAVAAVVVWHWWGRSIKRKEDKEKQEAVGAINANHAGP